jgi:2'-5' RNA ligase superfamily
MRDHSEWHRGRLNYGLWLVELASEEVFEKVAAAREHLSDFLLAPYFRQPHISLFICGFPADAPQFEDDFSTEQLRVQKESLKHADIRPFAVEVGGLNSFASAPYLEVRDLNGGLDRVRAVLSTAAREIGRSTFTPHVTIGLYSAVFPSSEVMKKIAAFQSRPVRAIISKFTFATYEAREIAGALTFHYTSVLE